MNKLLLFFLLASCSIISGMDEEEKTEDTIADIIDYTKDIPTDDDCQRRKPTYEELEQNPNFIKDENSMFFRFLEKESTAETAKPKIDGKKIQYLKSSRSFFRFDDPEIAKEFRSLSHNKQKESFFSDSLSTKLAIICFGGIVLYLLKKIVDHQSEPEEL